MLEKIKSFFTTPTKKEEPMAATGTTTTTTTTPTRSSGKVCSMPPPAGKEQLSATSDTGECTNNAHENTVRERAYKLWELAGYPSSDGVSFWLQAEDEIKATRE